MIGVFKYHQLIPRGPGKKCKTPVRGGGRVLAKVLVTLNFVLTWVRYYKRKSSFSQKKEGNGRKHYSSQEKGNR